MAEEANKKVEKLKHACNEAYVLYPHSCSHAVWHVIKQNIPDQPYLTANGLIHNLTASPEWQEVQLSELTKLANEGVLVVGGATQNPNGHVIAVYPGAEKYNGGYHVKQPNGKVIEVQRTGIYARAMSTSMGNWPGTKSNGDKTVRDPWGADKFKEVKFWRYVGK